MKPTFSIIIPPGPPTEADFPEGDGEGECSTCMQRIEHLLNAIEHLLEADQPALAGHAAREIGKAAAELEVILR